MVAFRRPVDASVEIGRRLEHVEDVAVGRGERRVVDGRHGDQHRRVAHAPAVVDHVAKRSVPRRRRSGCCGGPSRRELARHPGVPHDGGRGVAPGHGAPRRRQAGEQRPVGDGEVGVAHHGVGGDLVAVGQAHAAHGTRAAVGEQDAVDRSPVAELGARPGRRVGERDGQPVHAADRGEHAVDGVHVRDHRIDRQRLVRRQPRVHRLEAEDPAQPIVREPPADRVGQSPEAAESQQPDRGRERADEVERRVEVAIDEVRHLELVELGEPVAEAVERGRFAGPAHRTDLVGHRLAAVPHVQDAPVGERRPVHRVDPVQRQHVGGVDAGRGRGTPRPGWASSARSGPVSNRYPASSISPARPPGRLPASSTRTGSPRPARWHAADSPPRPAPMMTIGPLMAPPADRSTDRRSRRGRRSAPDSRARVVSVVREPPRSVHGRTRRRPTAPGRSGGRSRRRGRNDAPGASG